jgi:hypothetical protein
MCRKTWRRPLVQRGVRARRSSLPLKPNPSTRTASSRAFWPGRGRVRILRPHVPEKGLWNGLRFLRDPGEAECRAGILPQGLPCSSAIRAAARSKRDHENRDQRVPRPAEEEAPRRLLYLRRRPIRTATTPKIAPRRPIHPPSAFPREADPGAIRRPLAISRRASRWSSL